MTRTARLEGAAVDDWFLQRSLRSHPGSSGPAVLVVDEVEIADIVVRRLWHTPMRLVSLGERPGTSSVLTLQAENSIELRFFDGSDTTCAVGDAFLYPRALLREATTSAVSARIEVVSSHLPVDATVGLPGIDEGPAWRALASTVNSILNSEPSVTPTTRRPLRQAVESLCLALISDRGRAGNDSFEARSAEATFTAAMSVIHERSADATFSVEELARAVRVSRQYLARVFARRGLTPSDALRSRRLDAAEAMISIGVVSEEAARRSGFPSVRALTRARNERQWRRLES